MKIIYGLFLALFLALPAAAVDTVRPIGDIITLLPDNATKQISPQDLRDTVVSLDTTGWGQYSDTANTCAGTPFAIAADTDTNVPNNAGSVIETYKPRDVTTFYDGTVITGRTGDGLLITVDMIANPTSVSTTYAEVWFDIGAPVGELYRRIITFPKGNGVIRPINFTVAGYTLNTWEANGATVRIRTNGTATICDVRYIITRTHRGSSDN